MSKIILPGDINIASTIRNTVRPVLPNCVPSTPAVDTEADMLLEFGGGELGGAYSVNAGAYIEVARTTLCDTLNQRVGSVTDVRSANHSTQSNSSYKPYFITQDGCDCIYTNAMAVMMAMPDFGSRGQPWTVGFAAYHLLNDNTTYEIRIRDTFQNATLGRQNSGSSYVHYINNGVLLNGSTATSTNTWYRSIGVMNGTSSDIIIDGSSDSAGNAGTGQYGRNLLVLAGTTGALPSHDLYMYKWFAIDKALDATGVARFDAWLADRTN